MGTTVQYSLLPSRHGKIEIATTRPCRVFPFDLKCRCPGKRKKYNNCPWWKVETKRQIQRTYVSRVEYPAITDYCKQADMMRCGILRTVSYITYCSSYVPESPRSKLERDIKPRSAGLAPGLHHHCNGVFWEDGLLSHKHSKNRISCTNKAGTAFLILQWHKVTYVS